MNGSVEGLGTLHCKPLFMMSTKSQGFLMSSSNRQLGADRPGRVAEAPVGLRKGCTPSGVWSAGTWGVIGAACQSRLGKICRHTAGSDAGTSAAVCRAGILSDIHVHITVSYYMDLSFHAAGLTRQVDEKGGISGSTFHLQGSNDSTPHPDKSYDELLAPAVEVPCFCTTTPPPPPPPFLHAHGSAVQG